MKMRRRVWRRAVVMKSKPVRLVGGLVGWGGDAQLDLGFAGGVSGGKVAGCDRGDGGRGGLRGVIASAD